MPKIEYKNYFLPVVLIFVLKVLLIGVYDFYYLSEIRYASISMRMALTGNYLMPYFLPTVPFFGKPPLSFWASAISFKLLGYNEFAGRLPHLLALVASVVFLYNAIKKIYDSKTAITSVIFLSSCALFYALHSVMTESFLLLGMTITICSFMVRLQSDNEVKYGYFFFIGCIISMMTKGPVGVAMVALPILVYLIISKRFKEAMRKFPILLGSTLFLCAVLPWFIMAEMKYPGFLQYFLVGENLNRFLKPGWNGDMYGSAHTAFLGKIWYFFFVCTIPAVFLFILYPKRIIISIVVIAKKDQLFLFLCILFVVPMLVLSFMRNMIGTYALYSILPFSIVSARIIALNEWHKFIRFIAWITVALHVILLLTFVLAKDFTTQKLNYQAYLIKHIPQEYINNNKLYYFNVGRGVFPGYWFFKDRAKDIDAKALDDLLALSTNTIFVIGDIRSYNLLPLRMTSKLKAVVCYEDANKCLYKVN